MKPSIRFSAFIRRSAELFATRLAKSGFHVGVNLSASDGRGSITPRFPDEEELRSYLTVFRPFTLERETVHLGKTFNVAEKALASASHRGAIRSARRGYAQHLSTTGIGLVHNGRNVSPENTLDLFLNGIYFHADQEKVELLAQIPQFGMPLVKMNFLNVVIGVSEVIQYTAAVLKDAESKALVDDTMD